MTSVGAGCTAGAIAVESEVPSRPRFGVDPSSAGGGGGGGGTCRFRLGSADAMLRRFMLNQLTGSKIYDEVVKI